MIVASLDPNGVLHQDSRLEAQLQTTLNMVPAHAWYALPNGGLTFVNERTADYLGLPKDHPLRFATDTGADWDSHIPLLHEDDREETRRIWSDCLRTGHAGQATFRVRDAEGGYRWFLSCAEPVRAANGTLLYWIGVNLDIEDRKRAEDKIREQEAELRQILDLTPQLIAVFGPHYRERLFINRMALDYFGLTLDEWRNTAPGALSHPDDSKRVQPILDRAMASGSALEAEGRLRKSDGSYRWFLVRYNPVRDVTPQQFDALLELIAEPYATMIYVAVYTGLRISELCALRWRNVNDSSISIEERFCRGDWGAPKSEASNATIAVNACVISRIERLKTLTVNVKAGTGTRKYKLVKSDGPDDLVFQSVRTGAPMRDNNILSRHIKPAVRKLGLGFVNWRCLRTSHATWLKLAGADVKDAQAQMRHSRASTTLDIYQQFVPESQKRVVEKLSSLSTMIQ